MAGIKAIEPCGHRREAKRESCLVRLERPVRAARPAIPQPAHAPMSASTASSARLLGST